MKTIQHLSMLLIVILFTACGAKSNTSDKAQKAPKHTGDIKMAKIEEAVLAALADEGESDFSIVLRSDEATKTGTEQYKNYGPVPFQTYFVRSKSKWTYHGRPLDVYRHIEVKYYKLNKEWTLDKARVFNAWLDNVANPMEESTMLALIQKDPWGTFGHGKAIIESISPVNDFYKGMPGIHKGQFYPTDYSSKQVKAVFDIVFTDKGKKLKGRYEIKFGRGGVDEPWNRTVSYRRIKEETL